MEVKFAIPDNMHDGHVWIYWGRDEVAIVNHSHRPHQIYRI